MYDLVEMVVELVFFYYLVGHGDAQGLHWVINGVVVGADHAVEVVDDVFFEVHHFVWGIFVFLIINWWGGDPPICIFIISHYIICYFSL